MTYEQDELPTDSDELCLEPGSPKRPFMSGSRSTIWHAVGIMFSSIPELRCEFGTPTVPARLSCYVHPVASALQFRYAEQNLIFGYFKFRWL